ncbi:hypothetical protein SFC76_11750 [Sphingomonas sp. CD22]|uniref:hypothetical protein n=1 Tax=Sphingomonas sp. CD22 TaxID=3100214 RepID=UPI002AE0914E|nr:hypothetical protein [Sphingomonas sp. CD22]MEA1084934.1 hypothetical protein [Sphingomonas sp. CD22]
MRVQAMKVLALLFVSGLYWQLVCEATGAKEPWDGDGYGTLWYPLSLALAAVAGYFSRYHAWLAGGIITFSQLPVMWINNGIGPLIAAGLLFLCILAVPAVAISSIAGRFAMRIRSS